MTTIFFTYYDERECVCEDMSVSRHKKRKRRMEIREKGEGSPHVDDLSSTFMYTSEAWWREGEGEACLCTKDLGLNRPVQMRWERF